MVDVAAGTVAPRLVDAVERLSNLSDVESGGPSYPSSRPIQRQVRLRPTQVDELINRYQAGESPIELAKEFGIARQTVYLHVERLGVPRRRNPGVLTEEQVASAVQLYQSGLTLVKVGDHFGVAAGTIRTALINAGIERRPRGKARVTDA